MSDPDFEKSVRRTPLALHRCGRWLVWAGVIGLLALGMLGQSWYSRRPYTCAVCRMDRVDQHLVGVSWSRKDETECSRWYRENVEQSHAHAWVKGTYCRRRWLGGYACTVGGPLTGLSRRAQVAIYQHFEDRFEAKRLFLRLGQIDSESLRLWKPLMAWVEEGYPGTWRAWWEHHRAGDETASSVPSQP